MKPSKLGVEMNVLYLFAGVERKADFEDCLLQEIEALNSELLHHHITLVMENVDTLRGGQSHNLLCKQRRDEYIQKIKDAKYDLTVIAAPCNKHSRAVFANSDGPKPIRDFWHPRGFKDLPAEARILADESNTLLDFGVQAIEAVAEAMAKAVSWRTPRALFEFPEDLGEAKLGTPASAWQETRLVKAGQQGMDRGAVFQCEWAEITYQKPTGLMTNIREIVAHEGFYAGWPAFISGKMPCGRPSPRIYNGPLPRLCKHGNRHEALIGRSKDGGFKTGPTGAYPPDFCRKLAKCCLADFCRRMSSKADAITPMEGRAAESTAESSELTPATLEKYRKIRAACSWEHLGDNISVSSPFPAEVLEKLLAIAKRCQLADGRAAQGSTVCLGLTSRGGSPSWPTPGQRTF